MNSLGDWDKTAQASSFMRILKANFLNTGGSQE